LRRDVSGGLASERSRDYGTRGEQSYSSSGQIAYRDICAKCGAHRIDHQIGLEPTPEEYVQNIVNVFREVWRVLRDDGTVWCNLGDSYTGSANTGGNGKRVDGGEPYRMIGLPTKGGNGLKPKDLLGIPWRVAFALQADGWYLRSDIIWHKPNPMPESVTDRPTKSHEYLFLLSKNARYYYDAEAVKEAGTGTEYDRTKRAAGRMNGSRYLTEGTGQEAAGDTFGVGSETRNRRDVWTIATSPYSGAHFATFPPALVEPCILAGTSERGQCPRCGMPWGRVVEYERTRIQPHTSKSLQSNKSGLNTNGPRPPAVSTTTGWHPACSCNAGDPIPQIVLDPFAGTFTVGMVAAKHRRDAVGIELSADYIQLARKRCSELQVRLL
jgi:DNA modification methylase